MRKIEIDNLNTLEDYAGMVVVAMLTLQTYHDVHVRAYNAGILDEGMIENVQSMLWEIERLVQMYERQLQFILDVIPIQKEEILKSLEKMQNGQTIHAGRSEDNRVGNTKQSDVSRDRGTDREII